MMENFCDVNVLVGKVLTEVLVVDDEIVFTTKDNKKYKMCHWQDCCESVYIESIIGDLSDLVGEQILVAEEVSSDDAEPIDPDDAKWGTFTWTFYKFATRKGYVDIRWYGSSNGYYSESVDFFEM